MSFDQEEAYNYLVPHLPGRVRKNEPLAEHSAFGVGGNADLWVEVVSIQEVRDLVMICMEHQWPLLFIGEGRNILFADAGVEGIVARLDLRHYVIQTENDHDAQLITEAGAHWSDILDALIPQGWGGLTFGIGIPGTIGAGLASNAGAHKQALGDSLLWLNVLDARNCNRPHLAGELAPPILRKLLHHEINLTHHQHSRFRSQRSTHIDKEGKLIIPPRQLIDPPEIIVSLALHLEKQDPALLAQQCELYRLTRLQMEPVFPHTGPVFKDPEDISADTLIRQAGIRGAKTGDAQITLKNANYIINLGKATAQDIAHLMLIAHQAVLHHKGVNLSINLDLLGRWNL